MAKTPQELIGELIDYSLNASGEDQTPEQQDWSADLLEVAYYLMLKYPCGKYIPEDILRFSESKREEANKLRGVKEQYDYSG